MPPTLLSLPAEIRAHIFDHLTTPITITTSSHNNGTLTLSPPYPWPITSTSHLLRSESLPHLNRTHFHLVCLHGHFPPHIQQLLPDNILHRITTITLQSELTLRAGTTVPLHSRQHLEGTSSAFLAGTNTGPIALLSLESHPRTFPSLQRLHLAYPAIARGIRQQNPRQWFFESESFPRARQNSSAEHIRKWLNTYSRRSTTRSDVPSDVLAFIIGMFVASLRGVLARFKREMEAPREGLERDYYCQALSDIVFGPLDEVCAEIREQCECAGAKAIAGTKAEAGQDGALLIDPWEVVTDIRRRRGFEVKVSMLAGATHMDEDGLREYVRHLEGVDFDFLASATALPVGAWEREGLGLGVGAGKVI